MAKTKFTFEYELNASKKMLYQYFATPSGLSQWFADDVNIDEDHNFSFIWDGEDHKAKMVSHRTNSFVKFEFLADENGDDDPNNDGPNYVEFKIDLNELTQTTFIKVIDYSDWDDHQEQTELWQSMLQSLKETVGG